MIITIVKNKIPGFTAINRSFKGCLTRKIIIYIDGLVTYRAGTMSNVLAFYANCMRTAVSQGEGHIKRLTNRNMTLAAGRSRR
jgi:hypothetical protein